MFMILIELKLRPKSSGLRIVTFSLIWSV
jgi:hypothetical protein